MKQPVVLIGVGEMGGVFSRGFLRLGHPVYPITRDMDMNSEAEQIPNPALVLVSVGEADLHPTLEAIPTQWRDKLGLLQNELLPRDWQQHNISNPTVISVWFEKKKGQDSKVLIPSPAYGPGAELLTSALNALDIDARTVSNEDELCFELVRKNVYILTTNIAGLECGGTVENLWNDNQSLAKQVASDVMDIQDWLVGAQQDRENLMAGFVESVNADLEHKCMGRSAPARLTRALQFADEAGLAVPTLREIFAKHVK